MSKRQPEALEQLEQITPEKRRLLVDGSTCRIPRTISGREVIMLDMKLDKWYPRDPNSFDQFGEKTEAKQLFQLFLALCEYAKDVALNPRPKKGGNDKQRPQSGPDSVVNLSNEDDNMVGPSNQEEENNPDEIGEPVELYIEAIIKDLPKDVKYGVRQEIIQGYRFYFFVHWKRIKLNSLFAHMILRNAEAIAKRKRNAPILPQHAQWKKVASLQDIEDLAAWYCGQKYVANARANFPNYQKFANAQSPFCALAMFNPIYAVKLADGTAAKAVPEQNLLGYENTVIPRNNGGFEIHPQLPKYWYKVPMSRVSTNFFYTETLHYRRRNSNFVSMHLPLIAPKYMKIVNSEDPLDCTRLPTMEELDLDRIMDGQEEEDAEEAERIEMDRSLDDDFADVIERPRKRTKREITQSIIRNCGMENLYKADYAKEIGTFNKATISVAGNDLFVENLSPAAIKVLGSAISRAELAGSRAVDVITKYVIGGELKDSIGIELQNPVLVARKMYLLNQKAAFEKYLIWLHEKTDASDAQRAICEYIEGNAYRDHGIKHELMDTKLDVFQNMLAQMFFDLEHVYQMGPRAPEAHLMFLACMDALNMQRDGLKSHLLFCSERGGIGKSRMWAIAFMWLIKGTIEKYDYMSSKVTTAGKANQDNMVKVLDEVGRDMLDAKFGDAELIARLKQILTSGRIVTHTAGMDDDRNRIVTTFAIDCIQVILGSTNIGVSQMGHAWARRWLIKIWNTEINLRRSILELALAEEQKTHKELLLVEKANAKIKIIQSLVAQVEWMIGRRILTDVNTDAMAVIVTYLVYRLTTQPDTTLVRRVIKMARQYAILNAIEMLFFTKGAKYYGKPIEIKYLLELDPLLYVTSSMAVAAIGQMVDVFIDRTETILKKVLLEMLKKDQKSDNVKLIYKESTGYNYNTQLYARDVNPNYFQVKANGIYDFVKKVCGTMDSAIKGEDSNYKPSFDEIVKIVNEKVDMSITVPHYVLIEGKTIPDRDGNKTTSAYVIHKDQKNVWISYGWLMGDETDDKKGAPKRQNEETYDDILLRERTPVGGPDIQYVDHDINGNTDGKMEEEEPPVNKFDTLKPDEITPEGFLVKIIREIFNKKHQEPKRFIFKPRDGAPYLMHTFSTPGNQDPNAIPLTIPTTLQIQQLELDTLGEYGAFINPNRLSDNQSITTDLDAYAASKRLERLYMIYQQGERWYTYKIDKNCIEKNFIRVIGNGNYYEKGDSIEEKKKVVPTDSEIMDLGDMEQDEEETDESVDENEGFFLGDPVESLIADPAAILGNMTDEEKIKLFTDLDEYDEDEEIEDIDFNLDDYVVGFHEGRKVYHWETFGHPFDEYPKNATETQIKTVMEININLYKAIMNNSKVMNDLILYKAYKTEKDKEKTFVYPGDLQKKAEETFKQRWERATKYNPSLEKMAEELTKNPQALPGYSIDLRGNVVRRPDDRYNIAHFALKNRRNMKLKNVQ